MRKVAVFLVMMVAVWGAASGCKVHLMDLMSCRSAASVSEPTSPSAACCTKIKSLSDDDIKCLCKYKYSKSGMLTLLRVDADRAIQLPAICGLTPVKC